jgi:hypothetical protein
VGRHGTPEEANVSMNKRSDVGSPRVMIVQRPAHPLLRCAALLCAAVTLAWARPLGAQSASPDVTPLIVAAEEDCAAERLAMCRRRAEVALPLVPERSALRVRARGLLAITEDVAPDATAPSRDEVLAPLLDAAELAAGRHDGAAFAGHLAALRALAAAESPLLARAELLAPRPIVVDGTVVPPGYAVAPPSGPIELAAPVVVDDEVPGEPLPSDEAPSAAETGYHRRDDGELVDFYVMSAAAGAGFTTYLFAETGWATDIAPTEPGRVFAVAPVIGAGLFLLIPFGLDQIDRGMPAGAPASIAMGLRFGIGLSGLTLGAIGGVSGDDWGHVMFASTLSSAAIFGGVAYITLPHPSQVQMIQNAGLWGGTLGAFLALTVAPNVDGPDASRVGPGLALAGLGSGLVVGSILSGLELHLPSGRSWIGSLGMLAGAGAGGLVYLLIGGIGGDFDPTIAGVAGLLGSGTGLALGLALSEGMQGALRFDDASVSASIAPTEGGGIASLSGTF